MFSVVTSVPPVITYEAIVLICTVKAQVFELITRDMSSVSANISLRDLKGFSTLMIKYEDLRFFYSVKLNFHSFLPGNFQFKRISEL